MIKFLLAYSRKVELLLLVDQEPIFLRRKMKSFASRLSRDKSQKLVHSFHIIHILENNYIYNL